MNVVALEEQGDKVSIDKSEQYGQMHFLIWTNKLYNLDQYMLHFYELDKNDPVCEGVCQKRGYEASINGEKSEGRYLRVLLHLVNQDLGFFVVVENQRFS